MRCRIKQWSVILQQQMGVTDANLIPNGFSMSCSKLKGLIAKGERLYEAAPSARSLQRLNGLSMGRSRAGDGQVPTPAGTRDRRRRVRDAIQLACTGSFTWGLPSVRRSPIACCWVQNPVGPGVAHEPPSAWCVGTECQAEAIP